MGGVRLEYVGGGSKRKAGREWKQGCRAIGWAGLAGYGGAAKVGSCAWYTRWCAFTVRTSKRLSKFARADVRLPCEACTEVRVSDELWVAFARAPGIRTDVCIPVATCVEVRISSEVWNGGPPPSRRERERDVAGWSG